jgi:hypothetical protein
MPPPRQMDIDRTLRVEREVAGELLHAIAEVKEGG